MERQQLKLKKAFGESICGSRELDCGYRVIYVWYLLQITENMSQTFVIYFILQKQIN
jgi:hypothetical protein